MLIAIVCLALLLLGYCLTVVIRGSVQYGLIKETDLKPMQGVGRYIGKAYDLDPELGSVLSKSTSGVWLIPKGRPVPFHHDDEGFRVPIGVEHSFKGQRHPRLLFLGDSFTYGELVAAQDSFAFKTALRLHGEAINAGVPGYGLAQMVLQARRLIPKYKPDYIVVQYSPWLVTRAQLEFQQDSANMIVAPYYFDDGSGGVAIAPTAFTQPSELLSRVEEYKGTPSSFADRVSFLWRVAFPFAVHRDTHLALFRVKQWLGLAPVPAQKPDAVLQSAYAEIDALARSNGGQEVVLALGLASPLTVPGDEFPPGVPGVNGWRAMVERLQPQTSEEYVRRYFHWRGDPPEPVDAHPNEQAHAIIAEALAARIVMLEQQKDGPAL